MSLLDSIKSYETSLNNNKRGDNNENTCTTTRTNKKTDMQFSSIMLANNVYNKKMFKSQHKPEYKAFESEDEFERFIYDDPTKAKHASWKQISVCFKRQMCEEYVMHDESLSEAEKKDFVLKFDNTFLNEGIKYDAHAGQIVQINYTLLQ